MVRELGMSKSKTKMKKRDNNKIQSRRMEKDIERNRDISAAWLQGGKAIGEAIKPKKKGKKK